MKKILSRILVLVVALFAIASLAACDKASAEEILGNYIFEYDAKNVNENFTVPASMTNDEKTYDLKWTSNSEYAKIGSKTEDNSSYVVEISRPEEVTEVTLTVTLNRTLKDSASRSFVIRIQPIDVYSFVDEFSNNSVFEQNKQTVTSDFDLITEYALAAYPDQKATISWESKNPELVAISEDGKVASVTPSDTETKVTLVATFTYKGETSKSLFTVIVSKPLSEYEELQYWYNNTGVAQTLSGYIVNIAAQYDSSYGNVSIYMINDSFTGGYYLYRVKVDATEAEQIKLGAHVTVKGTTNQNYNGLMETNAGGNLIVDEDVTPINVDETIYAMDNDVIANVQSLYYRQSTLVSLTNWKVTKVASKLTAGENSDAMVVEKDGVKVTIRYSKYVQETLGEENAAALTTMLSNYKEGDYVNVKGVLSYYNVEKLGYVQSSYQILLTGTDSITAGTEDTTATPGKAMASALAAFEGFNESYIETTTIDLPIQLDTATVTWAIPESTLSTATAAKLEGNVLTITPGSKSQEISIIATYTIGEYSTVVYYYFVAETLTHDQVAERALAEIVIADQVIAGTVNLPAESDKYEGVVLTYALKGTPSTVTLAGNVLTIATPSGTEEVTIVATAKIGDATKTLEIVFKVKEPAVTTIGALLEVASANELKEVYKLNATIKLWGSKPAVTDASKDKYGNMIVTDGTNDIIVYGTTATIGALVWDDASEKYAYTNQKDFLTNGATKDLALGDSVSLLVVRTSYKETPQLYAIVLGEAEEVDPTLEPEVTNKTVAELIAISTEDEMKASYIVTGVISKWGSKLDSTDTEPVKYGNFVLASADAEIVVYGATASETALTWDTTNLKYKYTNAKDFLENEATKNLTVGTYVKLLVVRTSFNGTPQLNAIVLDSAVIAEPTQKTVAELLAIDTALEMTETYLVTGTISAWGSKLDVTDASKDKYGNMILANGEDKIIVYGATASASALDYDLDQDKYTYTNAKDFLENEATKDLNVGDTVTLLVVRTSYKGTPQLNAIVLDVTAA